MDDDLLRQANRAFSKIMYEGQMDCYASFRENLEFATVDPFLESGQTLDLEELVYRFFEEEVSKLDAEEREYYEFALAIHSPIAALAPKFRTPEMLAKRLVTIEWHYAFMDARTTLAFSRHLESLWDDLIRESLATSTRITGAAVYDELTSEQRIEFVSSELHSWAFEKLSGLDIELGILTKNMSALFAFPPTSDEAEDALVALIQSGIRFHSLSQFYVSTVESESEDVRLAGIGAFISGYGCVGILLHAITHLLDSSEENNDIGTTKGETVDSSSILGPSNTQVLLESINWLWGVVESGQARDDDFMRRIRILHAMLSPIGEKPAEWDDRIEKLLSD